MKAIVTGLPDDIPESAQYDIGQQWLMTLHYSRIKVDGVKVEFIKDDEGL